MKRKLFAVLAAALFASGMHTQAEAPLFTEDFEGSTHKFEMVNGTQPNQWHVGTAAKGAAGKTAYISNDEGLSHAYTITESSVTHMYAAIDFQKGAEDTHYIIQFDWTGYGESTYDYLRVSLIDTAEVKPATGKLLRDDYMLAQLNLNRNWMREYVLAIPADFTGERQLVFSWRNDKSRGIQPPAAIDNILVRPGKAAASKSVDITEPGSLRSLLSVIEKGSVSELKLTGSIDARDFKFMRDEMTSLARIDLSGVSISSYKGTDGPSTSTSTVTYPADEIPEYAFHFVIANTRITSITLPSGITKIGNNAFYNCQGITSMDIPASVTILGYNAFANCNKLTSVTMPGVKEILNSGFYDCENLNIDLWELTALETIGNSAFRNAKLNTVKLPASVKSIGTNPFYQTKNQVLSSITVDPGNANYKAEDNVLFTKDGTEIIACAPLKEGVYDVPAGVTSINERAFYYCKALTSVNIGDEVASIGGYAFYYCSKLTLIKIPKKSGISSYAFSNCTALTSAHIHAEVTGTADYMFQYCETLVSANIPEKIETINNTFYYCENLRYLLVDRDTPPATNTSTFGRVPKENLTVYVPAGKIAAYEAADGWDGLQYAEIDTLTLYKPETAVTISGATISDTLSTVYTTQGFGLAAATSAADSAWITFHTTSDGRLAYKALKNETDEARSATVTVTLYGVREGAAPSAAFTITQEASTPTGTAHSKAGTTNVWGEAGKVYVSASEKTHVSIYALNGMCISKQLINAGTTAIPMAAPGLYIVKADNKIVKIAVK